jgi:hypothetical protein
MTDYTKRISELREQQVEGINEEIADVFAEEQRANFERNQSQTEAVKGRVYGQVPRPNGGQS